MLLRCASWRDRGPLNPGPMRFRSSSRLGSSSQERRQAATMNRRGTWILGAAACVTVLGILIGFQAGSAQDVKGKKPSGDFQDGSGEDAKRKKPPGSPTVYNPYPPGIV